MLDEEEIKPSRSLDEYWVMAKRRRWYIILPAFACWAVAWAGSWLVQSTYQSDALILVEQQEVPQQYVVSNVTVSLQDRLQSMTQQILSRTRLQATIDRFRLYPKRRSPDALLDPDDPVEQMRKDIKIEQVFHTAEKMLKYDIAGHFPFIVGFPDESDASIQATLDCAKRLRSLSPDFLTPIYYFKPYPGSELAVLGVKEGRVEMGQRLHGHQSPLNSGRCFAAKAW